MRKGIYNDASCNLVSAFTFPLNIFFRYCWFSRIIRLLYTCICEYVFFEKNDTCTGKKSSGFPPQENSMLPVLLVASITGSLH